MYNGVWEGETIIVHIPPVIDYIITVGDVPNYQTPDSLSYSSRIQGERNVTLSYMLIEYGVFILHTNGKMYLSSDWNTSWNTDAVGIAVKSENTSFVIAPNYSEEELPWSNSVTTINGVTTTTNSNTAKADYAGQSNTDQIINQLGASNALAAKACRDYSFKDGRIGYLGSVGEWQEAFNNKTEVNTCITLIGGYNILTDATHWTSTQYNDDYSWYFDWNNGNIHYTYKDVYHYTRAFAAL